MMRSVRRVVRNLRKYNLRYLKVKITEFGHIRPFGFFYENKHDYGQDVLYVMVMVTALIFFIKERLYVLCFMAQHYVEIGIR